MAKIKFWSVLCFFLLAQEILADDFCHRLFSIREAVEHIEYTLALIRHEAIPYLARIENSIRRAGLVIELSAPWQPRSLEEKHFVLKAFYQPLLGQDAYPLIVDHMMKGDIQVMVISGPQAVQRLKELAGHKDPYFAEKGTLRQAYGLNMVANGLHRSNDIYDAAREVRFFMNKIPFTDNNELRSKVDEFAQRVAAEEFTLGLIKPEAVAAGHAENIMRLIESHGLQIVGSWKLQLKKSQAESFYQEHFGKPFFGDLVSYMSSGLIYVLFIKGPHAVKRYREVLGNTDPAQAAEGTIRKLYGTSKSFNAGHGSDSINSALRELNFFAPLFASTVESEAIQQFKAYANHVLQEEYSLALLTPDALLGSSPDSIRHTIEENGIEVAAMQRLHLKPWMIEKIYQGEKTRPYFPGFVNYLAQREVYALVLRAPNVVARFNKILGDLDPRKAAPGTIRQLLRPEVKYPQVLHGSPTILQGKKDVAFILTQMGPEENLLLRRDFAAYQGRHSINR